MPALRETGGAHGNLVPEFGFAPHVGDTRNFRHFAVTLQVPEALTVPKLPERILRRHEKDFLARRGVEQQITARLVDAREKKEGRFLDHFIPGLHVGLLGPRIRGDTGYHAKRIKLLEHRLAAFPVQISGIVARGIDKNLRIGLGKRFRCHF